MSLVLKSNQVASASLGNINGIKGKQDWLLFADFENQQYSKKTLGSREDISLLDTLTSTSNHNLIAEPITIDKFGNQSVITQENQVRTWLEKGRYGVLVEGARVNYFTNSAAPSTKTINISATSPIVVWCLGSGSVTVSGDQITTKLVTESAPQSFVPTVSTGTTDITLIVSGSLSHVQVERVSGFTLKTSKIKTSSVAATRNPDAIKLNQALLSEIVSKAVGGITIVVQAIPVGLMAEARTTVPENKLLLVDSSNNKTFVGVNRLASSKISARLLNFDANNASILAMSGNNTDYLTEKPAITQAFRLTANAGKSYVNGLAAIDGAIQSSLNLTELALLAGSVTQIQQGSHAMMTKLVIYGRALTDQELSEISTSWI